jgi:uncharacterized protein (TIGR01244 family)
MEYRKITDSYSVSGQIAPDDVARIKAAGFKSIIGNRPDSEDGAVPHAEIEKAARAAGLDFRFIPVVSGRITSEDVAEQAKALDELEGPVLAYCRSGTRCTNLFGLVQQAKRG